MTIIITFSGQPVNLAMPSAGTIKIRDLAHHLATINRFAGATALPYSVAQHSVVVAKLIEQLDDAPLIALQGLLHDAHEAYTNDIPTPTKQALPEGRAELKLVQRSLDIAIHQALGVNLPDEFVADTIRFADRKAFATEWRDLMPGKCLAGYPAPANFAVKPIPWHAAEQKFLKEFERLSMLAGIVKPKPPHNPTLVHIT